MKAFLKNYRQSPRKVRLVADLIKGKNIQEAIVSLDLLVKRASAPIRGLVLSAVANAKAQGKEEANLFVKELRVDKGIVMKRMMPRAMGRGARINKRTSNVIVVLGERALQGKKIKATKDTKKEKEVKSNRAKKPATAKTKAGK